MTVLGQNGGAAKTRPSYRTSFVPKTAKIESVITYLEMTAPPKAPPPPLPAVQHAIMLAKPMTVSFYRYLYNTVGGDMMWWERRAIGDDELQAILDNEKCDVFVLYVGGVPGGYYELVEDDGGQEIDLAYFGLMPEQIGRGMGAYLLRCAVDEAWRRGISRVTVNTCTMDHPNALPVYQRAGFEVYDRQSRLIDDPVASGLFA